MSEEETAQDYQIIFTPTVTHNGRLVRIELPLIRERTRSNPAVEDQ